MTVAAPVAAEKITAVVDRDMPMRDKHGREVGGWYKTYDVPEGAKLEDMIAADFGSGVYGVQFRQGNLDRGERQQVRVSFSASYKPRDREGHYIEVVHPNEIMQQTPPAPAPTDPMYALPWMQQFRPPMALPGGHMTMGMPADPHSVLVSQLDSSGQRIRELERRLDEQRSDYERRIEALRSEVTDARASLAAAKVERERAEDRFRALESAKANEVAIAQLRSEITTAAQNRQDPLHLFMIEEMRTRRQESKPSPTQQAMEMALAEMIKRQLNPPDDDDDGPDADGGVPGAIAALAPHAEGILRALTGGAVNGAQAPAPASSTPAGAPQTNLAPPARPALPALPAQPQPYATIELAKAMGGELAKLAAGKAAEEPASFVRRASAWLTQTGRSALIEACKAGTLERFLGWFAQVPGINIPAVVTAIQKTPAIADWLAGLRDEFKSMYGVKA